MMAVIDLCSPTSTAAYHKQLNHYRTNRSFSICGNQAHIDFVSHYRSTYLSLKTLLFHETKGPSIYVIHLKGGEGGFFWTGISSLGGIKCRNFPINIS